MGCGWKKERKKKERVRTERLKGEKRAIGERTCWSRRKGRLEEDVWEYCRLGVVPVGGN